MSAPRYDVVVCGGGVVGAAFAALLARGAPGDGRAALVEAREWPRWQAADEVDLRVSAVSRASQRILEACGVWHDVCERRASPYRRMCVWDAGGEPGGLGAIEFDAGEINEPDLGHIVENALMQTLLVDALRQSGRVELVCPAELARVDRRDDAVDLVLADGRRLSTRLLVAADGAGSPTRERLGIAVRRARYEQTAVVTHVRTTRTHRETAWQRFLPTGPLAMLPLADGRCSIVWSTSDAQAGELIALDDAAFAARLTEASGAILGEVTAVGARVSFPLEALQASEYVADRIALIGDAAHGVHPLAGQGLNLGLLDAATLAELIGASAASRTDPGDLRVLRRYERWRKSETAIMMTGIEALKRLFDSELPGIGLLRRWGLTATDRLLPVKRVFIRRAMGLAGELPQIVRRASPGAA